MRSGATAKKNRENNRRRESKTALAGSKAASLPRRENVLQRRVNLLRGISILEKETPDPENRWPRNANPPT
jgi:hypothetical protein